MARTPRNSPCPCGSGRKYKACCLAGAEAAFRASRVEERVWHRIQGWAADTYPDEYGLGIEAFAGPSRRMTDDQTLVLCSWLHLDYEPRGSGTFAERYVSRLDLSAEERAIASRIAAARLAFHRVLDVQPGEWIDLENMVRGTRIRVRSPEVSQAAVRWDVLLCRVLEGDGEGSLWGPAAFYAPDEEPELMEELIRLAGELGVAADADGLDLAFRRAALELIRFIPPSRSIEPVLLSVEGHAAAHVAAVWAVSDPLDALDALDSSPELIWMGPEAERDCFVWALRTAEVARSRGALPRGALLLECTPVAVGEAPPRELEDRVAVGSFELMGTELSFGALSSERLDAACALVEERLGEGARLLSREVTTLDRRLADAPSSTGPPPAHASLSGPEVSAIEASFVERQYRRFLDEPNPRLGGLTPRQAVSDPEQRGELRLIVRGIENHVERARRNREPCPISPGWGASLGSTRRLPRSERTLEITRAESRIAFARMSRGGRPTIDELFAEFLTEQRQRLSERTFHNYADVVDLLRHSLNGYGYSSLDGAERKRWEATLESGDEEALCHLFGAEKIPEHLGEFLGYFMVRKVMAGQELLRASGTVTRKLVRWLHARGHLEESQARRAAERAGNAARDLPRADQLGQMLHDVAASAPQVDLDELGEEDFVEDYLAISDVEPGRIWFEGGVGPIDVPRAASDLARPGWSIFITAARSGEGWHLLEVGFVYP